MSRLQTLNYPPSYYASTRHSSISFDQLDGNLECETCIIGAGYAGLMTALGLLERGHKSVVLLEQGGIAHGASGRNGGFVFAGYSLCSRQLVRQVGQQQARHLYGLTVDAVDLIRQRIKNYNIECDAIDAGVLWVNWFRDQRLLLDEQRFMKEQMHVDWEFISQEALKAQINTDRYSGALLERNAMNFHPLNYALGIAREIQQQGGSLFEYSPVIDVDASHAVLRVETETGSIQCQHVVLACGGYINSLYPKIARAILPVSTYVMATEPLGDRLTDYITTDSAVYDTRFAFDYYRALPDTRLLWGGRISASKLHPENLEALLRVDLRRVFPGLGHVKFDYVWDGLMGYPRHKMPLLGKLSDSIWYNIGYGGHGVGPTTMGGELIAAAIAQGDQGYRDFRHWGLDWNGGVFGPVAAQSTYICYQFRDWLKAVLE